MQVSLQDDRDLRRAEHMAGGMKFYRDVAEPDFLAIGDGLGAAGEIVAIAQPHHIEGFLRRQYRAMPGPGMVGMAVRDHGPLDRPHRIDMKAAGLATETGGRRASGCLAGASRYIGCGAKTF